MPWLMSFLAESYKFKDNVQRDNGPTTIHLNTWIQYCRSCPSDSSLNPQKGQFIQVFVMIILSFFVPLRCCMLYKLMTWKIDARNWFKSWQVRQCLFIVWIDYNDSISDKTTSNNITHLVDDLHSFYIKTKFYSIVCHLELELLLHVLSW
jgi:hypothetical protein